LKLTNTAKAIKLLDPSNLMLNRIQYEINEQYHMRGTILPCATTSTIASQEGQEITTTMTTITAPQMMQYIAHDGYITVTFY